MDRSILTLCGHSGLVFFLLLADAINIEFKSDEKAISLSKRVIAIFHLRLPVLKKQNNE